MDGTFKLNQVAYLVVVCGVSDRGRSFHLVAIFITSPRLEGLYVKALTTLRRMSTAVTSKQLLLTYVMADAEAGQLNAVNQVFGVDSELTYLICFYHVMAKVHERLTAVSSMDSGLTYLICFYNVMAKVHERLKAVSSTLREQQLEWRTPAPIKPPPSGFKTFFDWCQQQLQRRGWGRLDEAAARYLRTWGLTSSNSTFDTGHAIKRLLLAVPYACITKDRLVEAARQGEDAVEAEGVLPSGVDFSGRPTCQMKTILDDVRVNGKTLFLTSWEPTLEPPENLPSA
nr:hypothetical protein PF009_g19844 [Phytophthora fragariae]